MSVEPFVPIIVEATKFVFDEAGKWLETIRQNDNKSSSNSKTLQNNGNENVPILTQQEFSHLESNPKKLMSVINVQMAETNLYDIKSLIEQIQIHRKNLADNEKTKSRFGDLSPTHINRNIEDETLYIGQKTLQLKNLLEQVYGKALEH